MFTGDTQGLVLHSRTLRLLIVQLYSSDFFFSFFFLIIQVQFHIYFFLDLVLLLLTNRNKQNV